MTINQIIDHAPSIGVYALALFLMLAIGFIFFISILICFETNEDPSAYIFLSLFFVLNIIGSYFSLVYVNRESNVSKWKEAYVNPFIDHLPTVEKQVINSSVLNHYDGGDGENLIMNITYLDNGFKKTFKGVAEVQFDKNRKENTITFKDIKNNLPYGINSGFYHVILHTNDFPTFSDFKQDPDYTKNVIELGNNTRFGYTSLILFCVGILISAIMGLFKLIDFIKETRRTRRLNRALSEENQGINLDRYTEQYEEELEEETDEYIYQRTERIIR